MTKLLLGTLLTVCNEPHFSGFIPGDKYIFTGMTNDFGREYFGFVNLRTKYFCKLTESEIKTVFGAEYRPLSKEESIILKIQESYKRQKQQGIKLC